MKVKGFTHVSVHADDVESSARFYREFLGLEEIPSPDFPFEVRWFRVGDLQVHLVSGEASVPYSHHFALDVDDFEEIYTRSREAGIRVQEGYFSKLYELPEGAVQMFVLDPCGNLIEINAPDASSLDRSVVTEEIEKVAGGAGVRLYQQRSEQRA